jgi:hypothetical protein
MCGSHPSHIVVTTRSLYLYIGMEEMRTESIKDCCKLGIITTLSLITLAICDILVLCHELVPLLPTLLAISLDSLTQKTLRKLIPQRSTTGGVSEPAVHLPSQLDELQDFRLFPVRSDFDTLLPLKRACQTGFKVKPGDGFE